LNESEAEGGKDNDDSEGGIVMKWVCDVCGYEAEGDTPPEECPVCGVDSSHFQEA
jgi:rubrerythrin